MPRCPGRRFLRAAAAVPAAGLASRTAGARASGNTFAFPKRRYHICLNGRSCGDNPGLLETVRDAGVTDVWQAAFFYGFWFQYVATLGRARRQVEEAGMR
jgi:hypothetical protein